MADNPRPPVEKRLVIMCLKCDQWKMGGIKTRLCDECKKKTEPIDWASIWDNWGTL